ncbi:MAG: acyltransferase family protein [Flavobacteriales bacterium]
MKPEKIFISQLTFTRFVAAFIVVAYHYGQDFFPFNISLVKPLIGNGNIAVSYFFFLSGVVLSVSYWEAEKVSFTSFLKKRMARIYPVYIAAIALTVLILLIGSGLPPVRHIISQTLMLDAWYPPFCLKLNGPSWSLSVELFFYCMFPFCFRFFKNRPFKILVISALSLWILTHTWDLFFSKNLYNFSFDNEHVFLFLNSFPLIHFNTFLFGVMAGVYILKMKSSGRRYGYGPLFTWLSGLLILLVLISFASGTRLFTSHLNTGILCPVFMLITMGLAMDESIISRLFSAKPLEYLGNASYAMYLLQFPLLMIFLKLTGLQKLDTLSFYGYALFLTVLSCLTYSIYEKKMREWILRKR